jgi:predicted nucleotidyltransferase
MGIPRLIEQFLAGAVPRLQADDRLLGVAAGGSYAQGQMDEYSDIDLVLVARDEAIDALMGARFEVARGLGKLLAAFTGEQVGEPRLLICLYGPPLVHVDLKFVALRDFGARVEDPKILWERDGKLSAVLRAAPGKWPQPDPQWIEDRFWVWMHYAATKVARGELFDALDMLGFLLANVFGPLAMVEQGHRAQGTRRLETQGAKWLPALRETVATHDARSCGAALQAAVKLYRELRERVAPPDLQRRSEAEAEAVRYLESVIAKGSRT